MQTHYLTGSLNRRDTSLELHQPLGDVSQELAGDIVLGRLSRRAGKCNTGLGHRGERFDCTDHERLVAVNACLPVNKSIGRNMIV